MYSPNRDNTLDCTGVRSLCAALGIKNMCIVEETVFKTMKTDDNLYPIVTWSLWEGSIYISYGVGIRITTEEVIDMMDVTDSDIPVTFILTK